MKHLSEYRNPDLIENLLRSIRRAVTRPWQIMEVCGGQTHGLVKHGLLALLPQQINMIHGPGCPVCVTPARLIDQAVELALEKKVILCSYGDMLRVPGNVMSLQKARSLGADVRILYSPLDALHIAKENPEREVVFFAVGFETTAPANALSVMEAESRGIRNYSVLSAQVLVPPAIKAIMDDTECQVDAFLAPGHVCTIMGLEAYHSLVQEYRVPIVVTGFEPVDLLEGIWMVVQQLEKGEYRLENQYRRVVQPEGNVTSRVVMDSVYQSTGRTWRGLGFIGESGLGLREKFREFDATRRFLLTETETREETVCLSGDIMKGKIKPVDCPHFGIGCSPEHPMGAPMVSSEGACAAYYHYSAKV